MLFAKYKLWDYWKHRSSLEIGFAPSKNEKNDRATDVEITDDGN